jgi:hypothetical protein
MRSNPAAGSALLSVFQKVYVINLPERQDRRDACAAQLARIGLGFDHPSVELFRAVRPHVADPFPSIGMKGCFQSHIGVLQAGLESGANRFLLIEDDTDFSRDFPSRIIALANELAAGDWDIFYGWDTDNYAAEEIPGDTRTFEMAPDHAAKLTHFMGFNSEKAQRIHDYLAAMSVREMYHPDGGPMHVDGAYSWFRERNPDVVTLATRTPLAVQRPSRSDIHDPKWFDRVPVMAPVVDRLRQLKARLKG